MCTVVEHILNLFIYSLICLLPSSICAIVLDLEFMVQFNRNAHTFALLVDNFNIAPCRSRITLATRFSSIDSRHRASNVCRLRVRVDCGLRNFPFAHFRCRSTTQNCFYVVVLFMHAFMHKYNVGAHSVCQWFVASPARQPSGQSK